MSDARSPRGVPPAVGVGFVALLTVAHIGAYVSFVPLLNLLLPLQAQAVAPGDKIGLLGVATVWGAVAASGANLAAGWASDRTRHGMGRRRPWIFAGLVGVLGAYGLLAVAPTPALLILGVILFQLAFNTLFAPLNAILADRVPDRQKGRVAAFLGLGAPMGAASGVLITAPILADAAARLTVLGLLVAGCVLPLLVAYREAPAPPRTVARPAGPGQAPTADFGLVWVSRCSLQIAASVVNAFMLFYLADHAAYAARFPGETVESGLARLIAVSTVLIVAFGFLGGLVSDRLDRRRAFIFAGALLMATGLGVFGLWPAWPGPLVGYAVYGAGFGLYATVDAALVAQVLPSRRDTARDLGIMNLTNTLPAMAAPVLALAVLGPGRDAWPQLMGAAALFALVGGVAVLGVRAVR